MRSVRPVSFLVTLAAAALTASGCGGDSGEPSGGTTLTTGQGMRITFRSEPSPPQSGDNTYQVTVRQPDGTPITDATVTAVFSMPAMPSMNMPAMRSDAALTYAGNGTYRGTGQLSMGGTWNVEVSVARGTEPPDTARFSIVAK
jgi:hypothetical protein